MHWNMYLNYSISMVKPAISSDLILRSDARVDNKQLDRNEYNLWTKRTTGEEISDDDWVMIRGRCDETENELNQNLLENLKLDVDESISKKKFLELNEFEVKGEETNEDDLWAGIKAIGFNYALELDMVRAVQSEKPEMTYFRAFLDVFVQSDRPC